jgi:hypothetical protein
VPGFVIAERSLSFQTAFFTVTPWKLHTRNWHPGCFYI